MEALSVQAGIEVFIELQDKMAKNSQQYEQLAHTSKCKADHLTLDTFKVIHFANINHKPGSFHFITNVSCYISIVCQDLAF